jgi:hypothetical protein
VRGKREHPRHNGDEIDSARRTARQQPRRPGESAGSQSVMVSVSQSVSQLPRSYSYRIHKVQAAPACAPGSEAAQAPVRVRSPAAGLQVQHRTRHGTRAPPGPPARLGPGGSRGLAAARYLSLRLVNRVRVLGNGPGGRPFRVWYFMQLHVQLISWTESFSGRRPSHARRHPGSCDQQYG